MGLGNFQATYVRLFDFNPTEAKKVINKRKNDWVAGRRTWEDWDGADEADATGTGRVIVDADEIALVDLQGMGSNHVYLRIKEDVIEGDACIIGTVRTGSQVIIAVHNTVCL